MKIVIDIPEELYAYIQGERYDERLDKRFDYMIRRFVRTGTPLPKGHGRLIDADAITKDLNALKEGTNAEKSITGTTYWWTMSPGGFNAVPNAIVAFVGGSQYAGSIFSFYFGSYHLYFISNGYAVRPALSLTANTKWLSGNGTIDSPYQINAD